MTEQLDILIKLPEVLRQVGFSKSTIYELMASNAFPTPTKLGRYSRWFQNEVQAWIEQQKHPGTLPNRTRRRVVPTMLEPLAWRI